MVLSYVEVQREADCDQSAHKDRGEAKAAEVIRRVYRNDQATVWREVRKVRTDLCIYAGLQLDDIAEIIVGV